MAHSKTNETKALTASALEAEFEVMSVSSQDEGEFFDAQEEFSDLEEGFEVVEPNSHDEKEISELEDEFEVLEAQDEFFDAEEEFPEVREARAKALAAAMPILAMNQLGLIYNLQQDVKSVVENEDSAKAKKVLENIFKIEISPEKAMFQMAMMGNLSNDVDAQEFEKAIRLGLVTQYRMYLPILIKNLFDAKLISNVELAKLAESETGADIASYIKALALDANQEVDYSELALVLAIKQRDWNFVMGFQLLEDQLSDHEELLLDIYTANRSDVLEYCKESKVFGLDERIYVDINTQDANGRTSLMDAAAAGDLAQVNRLLALGANPALKDVDGNTSLMLAASYTPENIAQVNVPNSQRNDEIKKLMAVKAAVVKTLVADKRSNINDRNKAGMNAFDMAITQGLVTSEKGISELRGDHGIINALLSGGANPIFGEFEWSYKAKALSTVFLSVAITNLKNALINATGIGPILRFALSPLIEVLNVACDALVAYKAYYDVKNPVYRYAKTCLSSEYANDAFFSLDKKPMIGAFHINWMGKVYAGENLKKYMANHVGYTNVDKGCFSLTDLKKLNMPVKERLEFATTIANRYSIVQEKLNGFLMPWTRTALNKVAQEMQEAFALVQPEHKLPDPIQEGFDKLIMEQNHEYIYNELLNNKRLKESFTQMYAAVKSGALAVNLETRYNIEQVMFLLQGGKKEKSFFQSLWDLVTPKPKTSKLSFGAWIAQANEEKVNGVALEEYLQNIQRKFSTDLAENKDVRTFSEKAWDFVSGAGRYVVDKAINGAAYVCGTSADRVCDVVAEGVARGAGTLNAGGHVAIRRFYDSSYFTPACILGGLGYLAVKFPSKMLAATKCTFKPVVLFASLIVSAVSSLFACVSGAISYLKPKEASTAINIIPENKQPVVVIGNDVMKGMIESADRQISGNQITAAAL